MKSCVAFCCLKHWIVTIKFLHNWTIIRCTKQFRNKCNFVGYLQKNMTSALQRNVVLNNQLYHRTQKNRKNSRKDDETQLLDFINFPLGVQNPCELPTIFMRQIWTKPSHEYAIDSTYDILQSPTTGVTGYKCLLWRTLLYYFATCPMC